MEMISSGNWYLKDVFHSVADRESVYVKLDKKEEVLGNFTA